MSQGNQRNRNGSEINLASGSEKFGKFRRLIVLESYRNILESIVCVFNIVVRKKKTYLKRKNLLKNVLRKEVNMDIWKIRKWLIGNGKIDVFLIYKIQCLKGTKIKLFC